MNNSELPKCQVKECVYYDAEASGRCRRHNLARFTKKTKYYGGESRDRVMRVSFPGGLDSPRNRLVELLAEAVGDGDLANDVVDALDAYLEEGPDRTVLTFENFTPNYKSELEKVRAERDTAITCAEQALEQMQTTLNALRSRVDLETEPERSNGHTTQAWPPKSE